MRVGHWRRHVAIVGVISAIGVGGCGGGGNSGNEPLGGGSSADPDCKSTKDPDTGRYRKTPEKCHLNPGQ